MGCKALCKSFADERMCDACRAFTGSPFGYTWNQVYAKGGGISRSKASPHGKRGTHRQKYQNKTFKYMRVRSDLKNNYRILDLKMRAGELRWAEAEQIRKGKASADEAWSAILLKRR